MLFDLKEYASQDKDLSREFYDYLKAHELVPLKRQVSDLVKEIDSLILNFPNEIKISGSDKTVDLEDKKRALKEIIQLCPSAFEGQKLENFSDLFEAFNQTPEGRDILRGYRTGGGKSLLQYCGEMFLNQDDYGCEFGRMSLETILSIYHTQTILLAYLEDGVSITDRDWGITKFLPFLLDPILDPFPSEKAKQFLLSYRNKKGENLAQVYAKKGASTYVAKMRQMIDDDQQFKELLVLTQPGTESADVLLMKTKEGRQFLIKDLGEPQYSVKADSNGVTPLMRDALEMYPESFSRLLTYLEGHGVSVDMNQRDSFGNTIQSLQRLKQEYEYNYNYFLPLLVSSFKGRPLKESIWNDIVSFPYRGGHSQQRFIRDALCVVLAQPETPLHRAFLQKDVKGQKREANALWRSLLKTYDDLVDKDLATEPSYIEGFGKRLSFIKEQRKLPLAVRFLAAISPYDSSDHYNFISHTLIDDLGIEALIGNGTFRINFSRKITAPEAKIAVETIRRIAYGKMRKELFGLTKDALIDSLKVQLKNIFFQDYPFEIDEENKKGRLFVHRMDCAIIALEHLCQSYNFFHNSQTGLKVVDKFDFIDEQLRAYAPKGIAVNSKARFERLQHLYPEAF